MIRKFKERVERNTLSDVSTETRIGEVGSNLATTFRSAIDSIPEAPSKAVELSRFLNIDKTLAVRLVGAIKKQDPLAVCHGVPGPRGLRAVLKAARGKGVDSDLIDAGESSVKQFERLVQELGGSRSAFNTIISGLLPDVRERIERRNKKAAHDAMCNLLGHQVDTSFIACLIQPSKGDNTCDSVCFTGKVGLRHLTPRVARMIWAQRCTVPSWDSPVVSTNLRSEPISGDDNVPIIEDFCTTPLPEFKLYRHGGSVYVALADDETPSQDPRNIFIGSCTPGAFLRRRTGDITDEFISLTPSEPAKVSFIDVFLHDDVWPGASPALNIYRTGPRGNLDTAHTREFDRIDVLESVRLLGRGADRIHTNDVENYASMVRTVFDRVSWKADQFRVYRVRIEYPLLHAQIMLTFELPE